MKIKQWEFNPFSENTYLLYDDSKECVLIDPGNSNPMEDATILDFLKSNELNLKCILLTHSHIDHIMGLKAMNDTFGLDVYLHPDDKVIYENADKTAQMYGMPYNPSFVETKDLEVDVDFKFGNSDLEIRFVPGHAPGHVVFINHLSKTIIAGDTLFNGSIGRTDLPFGNHEVLISSIKEQMFTLPDEYIIYCGHGPETTVGAERTSNPFF